MTRNYNILSACISMFDYDIAVNIFSHMLDLVSHCKRQTLDSVSSAGSCLLQNIRSFRSVRPATLNSASVKAFMMPGARFLWPSDK